MLLLRHAMTLAYEILIFQLLTGIFKFNKGALEKLNEYVLGLQNDMLFLSSLVCVEMYIVR